MKNTNPGPGIPGIAGIYILLYNQWKIKLLLIIKISNHYSIIINLSFTLLYLIINCNG